ncbi:MAG: hypothetical protein ACD_71C00192G0005 [uncultured bacterium (gcode 4)]|uniref:Uncharacterized protein n=1 Tax=uncultured bacterium (gcode 4) TaxID=1234023 RepID=K1ZIK6_9BACT|nr:MAG: hypothetical protein ACD_71C00192G0005 [uncultured bacterium (gcode 4)]
MTEDLHEIILDYQNMPEIDQSTIDKTIYEISEILEEAASSTHEKVGQIIFLNIFEQDFQAAEEINNPKSTNSKAKLFLILENQITEQSKDKNLPKKTWLYNSVNLMLDKKHIENTPVKELYSNMNVSKRIELLRVKNIQDKIDLINKYSNKNSSVRDLRAEIGKETTTKSNGLLTYIKDPTKITNVDDIKLVGGKKKEVAIQLGKDAVESLTKEIQLKQKGLDNLSKLISRLEEYNPAPGRKKTS